MLKTSSIVTILILSVACKISPEEINYDFDECAFCKMKISDSRFGAELVTGKGKVYKYDSPECLFATLAEESVEDHSYILVTDFTTPKTLITAQDATYLISPNRPSPMGGNLSAYSDPVDAQAAKEKLGGATFNFEELRLKYTAER